MGHPGMSSCPHRAQVPSPQPRPPQSCGRRCRTRACGRKLGRRRIGATTQRGRSDHSTGPERRINVAGRRAGRVRRARRRARGSRRRRRRRSRRCGGAGPRGPRSRTGYAVAGGGVERPEGLTYLVQALAPVGDVVVQDRQGVGEDGAVAGPDGLDLVRRGQRVQAVQRREVGAELSRRGARPPSCPAPARCPPSAPRAPPAARTTASRRCARASRPRVPRARRPPPRRRRRDPRIPSGTRDPAPVPHTPPTPRTPAPPRSGRGGGASAARRPRSPPRDRTAAR